MFNSEAKEWRRNQKSPTAYLRDDGDPGAQLPQANSGDVDVIQQDATFSQLHQPKQGVQQRGLA